MSDKYINQLTTAATPILDTDLIIVSRDGFALTQGSVGSLKAAIRTISSQITSITNASNTTFSDITGLAFPVVAGKTYVFDFTIRYQAAATTTGIVAQITSPAGILTAEFGAIVAADGTGARFSGAITASADPVTTGTVAAANTDTVAKLTGTFVCTTTGTLTPQFRSSVNASNVVVSSAYGTYTTT